MQLGALWRLRVVCGDACSSWPYRISPINWRNCDLFLISQQLRYICQYGHTGLWSNYVMLLVNRNVFNSMTMGHLSLLPVLHQLYLNFQGSLSHGF